MHIGKFIKQYRKDNNLSMAEFAEKSGISKAYVSVLEKNKDPRNGKEIIPSIPTIKKISSAINISFDDILNALNEEQIISLDETELEKSSNSLPVTENETLPSTLQKITDASSKLEHKRQLVVLNTAENELKEQKALAIGKSTEKPQIIYYTYDYYDHPASAGTGQYLNDVQVEQIDLPVDYDADFVVPIYGNSMEPEFHSGDYVFVKLSVDLSDGDIGVFEYYGDAYIKQLLINEDGAFLHSLNEKEYDDIRIDTDSDFRIIGKILGRYRED